MDISWHVIKKYLIRQAKAMNSKFDLNLLWNKLSLWHFSNSHFDKALLWKEATFKNFNKLFLSIYQNLYKVFQLHINFIVTVHCQYAWFQYSFYHIFSITLITLSYVYPFSFSILYYCCSHNFKPFKCQDFHYFWTEVIRGQSATQGSMGRDPPRYPPRGPEL